MPSPMMLNAPYLARVYETDAGLLQLIDPEQITVRRSRNRRGSIAP